DDASSELRRPSPGSRPSPTLRGDCNEWASYKRRAPGSGHPRCTPASRTPLQMTDARGVSLAEVLVATCVLSVGLVAIVTGLQYATASVDWGRAETAAVLLAEARLEHLRSVGLADWDDPQLAPGTTREDYRT